MHFWGYPYTHKYSSKDRKEERGGGGKGILYLILKEWEGNYAYL